MDVPREKFLVAGDAWRLCRAGDADPAKFGLSFMNEAGYWWIAANLLRDVAALNNMEMLPWDVWGAMPAPGETIGDERFVLFDRLAELTRDPDAAFADLTAAYASDVRLRVPATVYNGVLNRTEPVLDYRSRAGNRAITRRVTRSDRPARHRGAAAGPGSGLGWGPVHLRNAGWGCYNFAVRANG